MDKAIIKNDNELILKRRKKRRIKKQILFLIFLACILVTLCLKLDYFNIKEIQVTGNKNLVARDIIKLSSIDLGNNIFYTNYKKAETNIATNTYIEDVSIKKKLPSSIIINVQERDAYFYNNKDEKFLIIDKNGIVLEARQEINTMKLLKIEGFDFSKAEIGKILPSDDDRKIKLLGVITELLKNDKSGLTISIIDISNILDIKIYYGTMCVKIGNQDDLKEKMDKSVNIINTQNLKDAKGYVDVSFSGNPVFYIEK